MHGGELSSQNIAIIPQFDLLIAAYSHQLYFFSLAEATIANKLAHHHANILSVHYHPHTRLLTSVDTAGVIVTGQVEATATLVSVKKARLSTSSHLTSAYISVDKSGEPVIYAIDGGENLLRFASGVTGLVRESSQKILLISEQVLVVKQSDRRISVIDAETLQQKYHYQHPKSKVTSAEIYNSNLIVADERGKITILTSFLDGGEIKLRQMLEWHVHQVTALKVDQAYLYSGGEEGVLVLWHLRENRRDFLPRVGAQITNIQVVESKVYCSLADNSIKSIDLNNDKALLHYKTVIDPRTTSTDSLAKAKVNTNLIRVSATQDQIFLRSQPGKIQSINLGNGVNNQFSVVSRNATSRLDTGYPNPHQLTDIAFSKDFTQFVASVQGVNCRSLKFYFQDQASFQLLSKVENCHKGTEKINLLPFGDKFLSYSESHTVIKVWKRFTRKKESILQVEQHYWGCEYEITYRNKCPQFVSPSGQNLVVVYQSEFVLFNTKSKKIEGTYSVENQYGNLVAVYQLNQKHTTFLVVSELAVQKIELKGDKATTQRLVHLTGPSTGFEVSRIATNQREQSFAFLVNLTHQQNVYIYKYGQPVQLMEIQVEQDRVITDLFWIGQRLLAFDSFLSFHDLTHSQELVHFHQKGQPNVISEQLQQQQTASNDYSHLYSKYLQRQYRRDRVSIDKTSQLLQITPSINSAFQLFTSHLFL